MRIYSLLAVILLLQSCHKSDPVPAQQTPADYFFPMKVGNFWVYKVTTENGIYPSYTINVSYDTLKIVNDTIIGGITYYQYSSSSWQGIPNGLWLGDSAGKILYSSGDEFPLSVVANDTMSVYVADGGFDYRVYKSGVLDTLINVPASAFQCLESVLDFYYLSSSPPIPNSNPRQTLTYFSQGIGIVKTKNWYSSGSGDVVSELDSYYIQA